MREDAYFWLCVRIYSMTSGQRSMTKDQGKELKMNRYWLYVYIAGATEILWAVGLKHSDTWWEWMLTLIFIVVTFILTLKAAEVLPTATVYIVFTGIGAVGTNLVDILVFKEPISIMKIFFIVLLIAGIIGLKLITDDPGTTDDTGSKEEVA